MAFPPAPLPPTGMASSLCMVQPGEYQVRVIAEGFSEVTETVNPATLTDSQPIEIVLEVAPSSASVTITDAYGVSAINTATKTLTPLRDIPQSISVVTKEQIRDQSMSSVCGRRRLRSRHYIAPGREQSRSTRYPRQQHECRFLFEWCARRRAVLPRPLQRRARRSSERTKLDALWSWRRRWRY